jgi:uncharacterized protein YxjI
MRYLMRQKLFCFGDDFTIKNEADEDVFFVDGKVFTIGQKLSFQDMNGKELAFIQQKLLSWGPTYEIYRDGQLAGPDDIEAQGSFTDMEYTFTRGTEQVAEVSKRWFTFADTYGVDIAEGEDDVLILASTVVIDMVCHGDHKNR